MTENTKEQAPAAADASHEVKQHPSVQDAVQGGPSYFKELEAALSRPDKTPRDWIVIGDAARAHLEAAPVLDELIEALEAHLDLIDDSVGVVGYHNNGEVATWREFQELIEQSEKAIIAANALQKLIERKG